MSSVKVILKKHRQRNDGTYPIAIRIYANGRTTYEYVGHSVTEKQFKDNHGKWISGHPDASRINSAISRKRDAVMAHLDPDAGYIRTADKGRLTSLSDYLIKRAQQFKSEDRYDMSRRITCMIKEVETASGRKVFFQEIDMDWIRKYIAHCKKNGNGNNTIMRKIKNLRTLYKQAITDKVASYPNPFDAYQIRLDPVNKTKLTREEIQKLEDIELPNGILSQARDAFLFAYYCHGMRFGSIFSLRRNSIKDGILEYQMDKGKKIREIRLHPKALEILKRYPKGEFVFPFCHRPWKSREDLINMKGSANAMVNAALKTVAKLAGIEKEISTHIARHSFAYQLKKSKIDPHIIKDSLGHTSMSTTEAYLADLDDDVINEAVNRALS